MPLAPKRAISTFRYAVFFDGIDDYAVTSSFMLGSQAFSYGFAIRKIFPNCGAGWEWIVHKSYTGVWYGEFSATLERDGRSAFRIRGADNVEYYTYYHYAEDLNWHDVFFVYNITYRQIYVDGNFVRSASGPSARAIANSALMLGRHGDGVHYPFHMSYFTLYSRDLSESEIRHNRVYLLNPIRNGLVVWLYAHPDYIRDIDGDGVLEWIDLSGFNNHAKLYGARLVELIKTPSRTISTIRVSPVAR